jgi:hypothetical protein
MRNNVIRRLLMNTFAKSALVLGAIGTIAIGSMTPSEARSGRWVAGAAGFAVGAAVGAAAANAAAYNSGYYYGGPTYAYDPGYPAAYDSYAYSPTYVAPAPAYVEPAVTYAEPAFVQPVQYRDPAYAYTGDPNYRRGYRAYGYAPGYDAYAYAPGYAAAPRYRGDYYSRTRSAPRHYDPGAGYNSNTVAPFQDWRMQGNDY